MRLGGLISVLLVMLGLQAFPPVSALSIPPTIDMGPDITVEVDQGIDLSENVTVTDPDTSSWSLDYHWDFNAEEDLNHDSIGDNDAEWNWSFTYHTFETVGTYTVTLTVSDGPNTVWGTMTVTVIPKLGESGTVYEVKDRIAHTRTVARVDHIAYKMTLHYQDKISIRVNILNGTGLGLLVMDSEGFSDFQNGEAFMLDVTDSRAIDPSVNFTWTFPLSTATYYVVIANVRLVQANYTDNVTNAPVTYELEIENKSYSQAVIHETQATVIPLLLLIISLLVVGLPSFVMARQLKIIKTVPYQYDKSVPMPKLKREKAVGVVGSVAAIVGVFLPWLIVSGEPWTGISFMFGGPVLMFWVFLPFVMAIAGIFVMLKGGRTNLVFGAASGMAIALCPVFFIGIITTMIASAYLDPGNLINGLQFGIFTTISGGVVLVIAGVLGVRRVVGTLRPYAIPQAALYDRPQVPAPAAVHTEPERQIPAAAVTTAEGQKLFTCWHCRFEYAEDLEICPACGSRMR